MNIDLFLTCVIFPMAWIIVMEYVKSNMLPRMFKKLSFSDKKTLNRFKKLSILAAISRYMIKP